MATAKIIQEVEMAYAARLVEYGKDELEDREKNAKPKFVNVSATH